MITNRFIHVGIPHTGGGTFHSFFTKWPGIQIIDRKPHQSYDWMAERAREQGIAAPPAFAFARNPWSWRVSMWCWTFAEYRDRSWFGETGGSFEDFLRVSLSHKIRGIYDNAFSGIAWSWQELQGWKADHTGRLENFEDDSVRVFRAILPDLMVPPFDEAWLRAHIQEVGKVNQRPDPITGEPHGPYQEYYSDFWRAQIAEWDKFIIDQFNYTFI